LRPALCFRAFRPNAGPSRRPVHTGRRFCVSPGTARLWRSGRNPRLRRECHCRSVRSRREQLEECPGIQRDSSLSRCARWTLRMTGVGPAALLFRASRRCHGRAAIAPGGAWPAALAAVPRPVSDVCKCAHSGIHGRGRKVHTPMGMSLWERGLPERAARGISRDIAGPLATSLGEIDAPDDICTAEPASRPDLQLAGPTVAARIAQVGGHALRERYL
jgi:hypothetical protein